MKVICYYCDKVMSRKKTKKKIVCYSVCGECEEKRKSSEEDARIFNIKAGKPQF